MYAFINYLITHVIYNITPFGLKKRVLAKDSRKEIVKSKIQLTKDIAIVKDKISCYILSIVKKKKLNSILRETSR